MATNLRLHPDAELALRAEALRTGRSQQELIRAAVDQFLGRATAPLANGADPLIASGIAKPPRTPFRRAITLLELPEGTTSLDLLDREDRF